MVEREGRWEDTKEEKSEKWVESRQARLGGRQGRRKRRNKRWEEGEKGPGKCQVHREHTRNNKAARRSALDARNTIKRRHGLLHTIQTGICVWTHGCESWERGPLAG